MTPFNKLVQSIITEMLDDGEEYRGDIGPEPGGDSGPVGHTRRERLIDEIYYLWGEIRKLTGIKNNTSLSGIPTGELEDMVNSLEETLRMYQNRENERPY